MHEALHLDRQLCFSLYSASRALTGVYRELLAELGLSYPQYLVMLVLWERDARSVREIGEALDLDSGTLSPLLKRLESAGLLRRERSAEDGRQLTVRLSEAGVALEEKALCVPTELMARSGLDETQAAVLKESLAALLAGLRGGLPAESGGDRSR